MTDLDPDPNPTITNHTIRRGREYRTLSNGTSQTRKLSPTTSRPITDWTTVEPPPPDTPDPTPPQTRHLSVVAMHQAPNEPKHWSLFSHIPTTPLGTGPGQVWQVTGDAELMHYNHLEGVDHLNADDFAWHQVVNKDLSEEQFAKVDKIARAEAPPRAESRAAVREHCQGWTVRVLEKLVWEGIAGGEVVEGLRRCMDPIN